MNTFLIKMRTDFNKYNQIPSGLKIIPLSGRREVLRLTVLIAVFLMLSTAAFAQFLPIPDFYHRYDDMVDKILFWENEYPDLVMRSEERRVGKECRCRWSPDQ